MPTWTGRPRDAAERPRRPCAAGARRRPSRGVREAARADAGGCRDPRRRRVRDRHPGGDDPQLLRLPEVLAARAAIAEGAIGDPEIAIVNALGVEDRPGSAAWRPGWRHDPTLAGGGVLMDMLHLVYVAEALLGEPFRRVSAEILVRSPGAGVEDVALCRFETDRSVALVNVGWGAGPGGITVSGPLGRIEIGYAGGGTGPFAPLAAVRLMRADGATEDRTPTIETPRGTIDVRLTETLGALFTALLDGRPSEATVADGLRALDATLGHTSPRRAPGRSSCRCRPSILSTARESPASPASGSRPGPRSADGASSASVAGTAEGRRTELGLKVRPLAARSPRARCTPDSGIRQAVTGDRAPPERRRRESQSQASRPRTASRITTAIGPSAAPTNRMTGSPRTKPRPKWRQ